MSTRLLFKLTCHAINAILFCAHFRYCNLHDVSIFDDDYIIVWWFLSLFCSIMSFNLYILRLPQNFDVVYLDNDRVCFVSRVINVPLFNTYIRISLDLSSWLRARFSNINAISRVDGTNDYFLRNECIQCVQWWNIEIF